MFPTIQLNSKLTVTKSLLIQNGYESGTHYIGMQNEIWMHCNNGCGYQYHELLVKSSLNFRYVCKHCKCAVEYVG